MRIIRYFLITLCIIGFSNSLKAQQLKENEIVVIHGEKFVLHQVRTGETVYSISKQFQVNTQELIAHNPEISESLKIGKILKIPYRENVDWQDEPVSQKGDPAYFEYYTIESRTETPYFIAKEFGITVEEIYAYNPEIRRFKTGTRLRIPRWEAMGKMPEAEAAKIASTDESDRNLVMHEVKSGETLYSLSRKYNIPESEILFFNPGAKNLKAGSIIYLPASGERTKPEESAEQAKQDDLLFAEGTADREDYFEHTILTGETLWSVTQKYQISEKELKKLNPALQDGFPAGLTLKIPVKKEDLTEARPVNEEAFTRHQVKAGETLYGLASQYNLTIPEIRKFNPGLHNRNLVIGEVLLIPGKPEITTQDVTGGAETDSLPDDISPLESDYYNVEIPIRIPPSCRWQHNRRPSSDTYDVALFLPLYIHTNDMMTRNGPEDEMQDYSAFTEESVDTMLQDTLVEMEKPREVFNGFYRDTEHYLQFYEGVLLAVDSLQRAGMNIRLHVYDTRQNADSIREFIHHPQFLRTDLIIGPVFDQVQKEVAGIAAKNEIPLVSPLSSKSGNLESNPFYFQVNPTREFLTEKTAELIAEEYFNSNFIVINTTNSAGLTEGKVIDLVREKLSHQGLWGQADGITFNSYNFSRQGPFELSRLLSKEKENVIFVRSMNEGDLSLILSNINNLADNYPITIIGFNRYDQFHSISREFFHNLKLQYVDPYWTDYEHPDTKRMRNKYIGNFHTEPGNFGMQGYDVAFYFLSALMRYGKHFEECLPYHRVHLTQGNFSFMKVSPYGGYMNQGVSVISYRRNYDVVRKRVSGPWHYAQKASAGR